MKPITNVDLEAGLDEDQIVEVKRALEIKERLEKYVKNHHFMNGECECDCCYIMRVEVLGREKWSSYPVTNAQTEGMRGVYVERW